MLPATEGDNVLKYIDNITIPLVLMISIMIVMSIIMI